MVDGEQETQEKPSSRKQGKRPFPSSECKNSEKNNLYVPSSSSSNLVVINDSIDDVVKQVEDRTMIQKGSLEKKRSDNHDDHSVGTNPEKKSPSAATSSLASASRISAQHSFESPVQSGYNQTHYQREAGAVEGGGQGFSCNDMRKGETQSWYNIQGHTQKEEKIKNDVLEVSRVAKELQVEYNESIFGKSHNTESTIMLRNQGSNCRKLGTSDDNPIQQAEGKKEDGGDDEDRTVPNGASFVNGQMRSVQANIHDFDSDNKYTYTKDIVQTKDKTNEEKLNDAERQQDSRSSSSHPSGRLPSISSPPLNYDISENRISTDYTAMKGNDNGNTTLKKASESQIPIPIRENTTTDQAVEEQLQTQDSSKNDKHCQDNTPNVQEDDDYRTIVRNRARNRRKNAAERNKKRQEEITRLTKANFELKEKNQKLINELVTLGVDAMTIQLFLNSSYSVNQQSTFLVPPP